MHKFVILSLLAAAAAFTAGSSTADSASDTATVPSERILYNVDAMYDQQGNLIAADISTSVSDEFLYWKAYGGTALMASEKVTNPAPVNVLPMAFQDPQSTPCMDPHGDYVYEVNGTTLRRFSTVDGSHTDYALAYTGGTGCATDGNYIYRPNGTSIYKYTMSGGYVNTTIINISCDAYSISVCGDTLWCTNDRYHGVNLYGYARPRFNGGSISQDAIWSVGTGTNGVGNVAFDGQYYYVPWIGTYPITFKRFYANRTLYTTGTVSIDPRSVMCTWAGGSGVEEPAASIPLSGWLAAAPNPVSSGFAALRYGLPAPGQATVAVYDLAGRQVYGQAFAAARNGLVQLELQNLNAGVYWVKLSSEGYAGTQRLLIVR